ncbi:type VII secretion target [Glycomyces endophyticus]|uniref:Type VII secretion target n=1 Tax=Glycomyces endophyticus TaxID=480996 RepID=A0ABP4SDC5_9ACTN
MSSGIDVDPDALRAHASGLLEVAGRFDAVRQASTQIFQDDEAYGLLCQFFPPILEERHLDQDAAVDVIAENLTLLADAVKSCADRYEEADAGAADDFSSIESEI